VTFGEITGTVYVRRGAGSEPGGGVELELVDGNGAVAKTVRSAFDGFYDLTGIPPGRYGLRVSPAQAQRLGLTPPPPRDVELSPSGTILDGIDVIVEGSSEP